MLIALLTLVIGAMTAIGGIGYLLSAGCNWQPDNYE